MTYIEALNAFNLWLESNALAASSQLLYFKLLNVFNRAGWPEYVQVDTRRIMSMIDAESEKTAIRARDRLVEAGFLSYKKGRKGSPNQYFLNFHCKNYRVSDRENDSISDSISDSKNDRENASHIKTKNKTKNLPYSPPQGGSVPQYKPEWFERFYRLYPRHTARQAAVKAWDKLKPDFQLCKVMEAALQAQMQSAQWQDRDCIPHPSTWLNGARWTDEVPDAAQKTGEQHSAPPKYHLEMIDGEEVVIYDD